MDLEMSQSSLEYATCAVEDGRTRAAFFELMYGNGDTPSELYRTVVRMLEKYVEHLRVKTGDRWSHAHAAHAVSVWLSHATFILAGLYAINGRTFPRLRPGLVEALEKDCDTPEKMRERETLLRCFGEGGRKWMDAFAIATTNFVSRCRICDHGIAYIYVLGTAFVHEMEDTSDDALLSEGDRRDIAVREKNLGGFKNEVEEILEKLKF